MESWFKEKPLCFSSLDRNDLFLPASVYYACGTVVSPSFITLKSLPNEGG